MTEPPSHPSPPTPLYRSNWAIGWTLVCFTGMVWLESSDHVTRGVAVPILFLLWLTSLGGIWIALGRRVRARRLLQLTLGTAAAAFAMALLFRYDGSVDGTARPKLTWRWSPANKGLIARNLLWG